MKLCALIIDDSRIMRNMVMEALRKMNLAEFEFVEAGDGADALVKFNEQIDIAFIDWNMPKMSGIEFVRQVRQQRAAAGVPLIMVTSESTMGKIEQALDQAGATQYITKPFTLEEMRHKVTKYITEAGERRKKLSASGSSAAKPAEKTSKGFFSKLLNG